MGSLTGNVPIQLSELGANSKAKAGEGVLSSNDSSQPHSRGEPSREKKRVGFTGGLIGERGDGTTSPPEPVSAYYSPDSGEISPMHSGSGSNDLPLPRSISKSHLPELSKQQTREIHQAFGQAPKPPRPRPAMRRAQSGPGPVFDFEDDSPGMADERARREARARQAFERGKRLEHDQRSEPQSRQGSPQRHQPRSNHQFHHQPTQDEDEGTDEDEDDDSEDDRMPTLKRARELTYEDAERLVRKHTSPRRFDGHLSPEFQSGAATPTEEQWAEDYRPRPHEYRGGVFGALLRLYNDPHEHHHGGISASSSMTNLLRGKSRSRANSETPTPQHSPPASGTATPRGSPRSWFSRGHKRHSTGSLAHLVGTSAGLGTPIVAGLGEKASNRLREHRETEGRPGMPSKSHSSIALAKLNRVTGHKRRAEEEIRITVHIAQIIARHKYLQNLCKALMLYGAPTHRLEEYMRMSARVLEIEAQFLYIPGSMIMSFDDPGTHTTEVKLVRVSQGLDLGKLRDVHEVYKDVVHDRIYVDEAMKRLNAITSKPPKHSRALRIPVYGLAAVCVGPFAFQARAIDLPIIFFLGCILGILQLVVAPASDLYANVFEISAAVITSFLSRAFGSIPFHDGTRVFCFSALAQSSIALILPGYIVLCASLELQSKSIVAGSVRMVYAIIYSLFLGYGITIGTAIYGLMDDNATSDTNCTDPIPYYYYFAFVPGFAVCLTFINQAKWKQVPVMVLIALIGYIVNFYSAKRFAGNTQVSNTLGALAIGVMANLYSRIGSKVENWFLDRWEDDLRPYYKQCRKTLFRIESNGNRQGPSPRKLEERKDSDTESLFIRSTRRVGYGLAAAAMLPAIFVQVPSGLAVSGSLISGLASANQITGNGTNGTSVVNTSSLTVGSTAGSDGLNSIAFNVSYSVVQVAIGITVGLFLSAIVVYPFGKRRSGLFSM